MAVFVEEGQMRFQFTLRCAAIVFVALVAFTMPATAQLGTGSVTGSVRDTSGGAIPGASVTLTSSTKTTSEDAITNASGDFVFSNVPADTYVVKVKMDGFKTLERPDVIVHSGDRVAVGSLAIEVGTLQETVVVSGEAPMIQAQSGERSFAITSEVVQNTAINGRNISSLTFLAPGMVAGSVNGTRTNQNNFQIDGIGAMDTGNNGVMIQVNPEAIAEVKVLTSNYQANTAAPPVPRSSASTQRADRHIPRSAGTGDSPQG